MNTHASIPFVEAVDRLEALRRSVAELMSQAGDHRLEVVRLRRQIAHQLGVVGQLGEALFAGTSDLPAFRTKLASLRATTAEHQASWPAVMLGERRGEFLASVEPMRLSGIEFIRWAREAVRRDSPHR